MVLAGKTPAIYSGKFENQIRGNLTCRLRIAEKNEPYIRPL